MKKTRILVSVSGLAVTLGAIVVLAQQPAQQPAQAGRGQQPAQPMSFFVTSATKADGANRGGIAGADAQCQTLAAAAGRGNAKWQAYLSTQGANAVNARDRIGKGPWYNQAGQMIARDLEQLHGDTLELARVGNNFHKGTALTEKGAPVNGQGDKPNQHDILTGSQPDGRAYTDGMDHTCNNWTSNSTGSAQLGHSDRRGGGNNSWNSAHPSKGCSQENLIATGGAGFFYCFAVN
jgi:hypothetical protein